MKLSTIKPNQKKALFLARRLLPEFVCESVNLEGIAYTLPEVQTLLQGITVGGHLLSDERIALNQSAAWKKLFSLIENNEFALTKEIACALHAIAACEESLSWGVFRTGNVTIAGTDYLPPPPNQLDQCFSEMIQQAKVISDIYDQAIFVFLTMARVQFFYDVNKRMGRFFMNGILLNSGFPAINLPAKRQLEFNQLMLDFYKNNDQTAMRQFMKSCLDDSIVKIMSEV